MNKGIKYLELSIELQRILLDVAQNPEVKREYDHLIERIKEAFQEEETCERCGKTYENYILPNKWWNKLPEEEQEKCLCFSCYLELLGIP